MRGVDGWQPRQQAVLLICGRCRRREDGHPWVRGLRRKLLKALGNGAITVTVCECMGSCPAGKTAMMLVSPEHGCWEWAYEATTPADTDGLTAFLAHPSVGLAPGRRAEADPPDEPFG